jgi:hypothetical protein
VVSTTAPLVSHGSPPVERTVDPSLTPGETVVVDPGSPALTTSVTRTVYSSRGKLLHHDVWYSSYRAQPELVDVGPAKPKPKPATTATTTTTTTQTTTTRTTPGQTTPKPSPSPPHG